MKRFIKKVLVGVVCVVTVLAGVMPVAEVHAEHGSHGYYTTSSKQEINHDGGCYIHMNGPYGFACYYLSVSFAGSKPTAKQMSSQTSGLPMNLSLSLREGTGAYGLSLASTSLNLLLDINQKYYILNPTFYFNSLPHYSVSGSASKGAPQSLGVEARFNLNQYSYSNNSTTKAIYKDHYASNGSFSIQMNTIQVGLRGYKVGSTYYTGHDSTITINQTAEGQYSVSYNANGGTSTPATTYQWACSATTLAGAISRNNDTYSNIVTTFNYQDGRANTSITTSTYLAYSFASWSGYGAGTSQYWSGNSASLTAQWNVSRRYTSLTLPSPTRTGYDFDGWYTASSGGTKISGSYAPTSSGTLYAHWIPHEYDVIYNGNNATGGTTSSSHHIYDVAKNLNKNQYTRKYDVFYFANADGEKVNIDGTSTLMTSRSISWDYQGWSLNRNDTSATFKDGQSVINLTSAKNGIVNMYAVWTGGNLKLLDASRNRYTFMGWSINTNTKSGDEGYEVAWSKRSDAQKTFNITSNTNYYAVWDQFPVLKVPDTLTLYTNDYSIKLSDLIKKYDDLYSATDREDGDITKKIVIESIVYPDGSTASNIDYNGEINTSITGKCTVNYKVVDGVGGHDEQLSKTIYIDNERISDKNKYVDAPRFISKQYSSDSASATSSSTIVKDTLTTSRKWNSSTELNKVLLKSLKKIVPVSTKTYTSEEIKALKGE